MINYMIIYNYIYTKPCVISSIHARNLRNCISAFFDALLHMKQQTILIFLLMVTSFAYNLFVGHALLPMIASLGVVFCLYVIIKSFIDAVNINECVSESENYKKQIEMAMKSTFNK